MLSHQSVSHVCLFFCFYHTYQMALRDLVPFCLLKMSEVLLITLCFLFIDRLDDLDADLGGQKGCYIPILFTLSTNFRQYRPWKHISERIRRPVAMYYFRRLNYHPLKLNRITASLLLKRSSAVNSSYWE